jgi:hypothetical protein
LNGRRFSKFANMVSLYLVVEGLGAGGAGVGLALVHGHVLRQVRLRHKGLGAAAAGELATCALVAATVLQEEALVGEVLTAPVAAEWLFAGMNPDVLF